MTEADPDEATRKAEEKASKGKVLFKLLTLTTARKRKECPFKCFGAQNASDIVTLAQNVSGRSVNETFFELAWSQRTIEVTSDAFQIVTDPETFVSMGANFESRKNWLELMYIRKLNVATSE